MTIIDYLIPLLNYFTDTRVKKKAIKFIIKLIELKQMNCWKVSVNHREYDRNRTLLDGSLKNTLSSEKINEILLNRASQKFHDKETVILIHDPCDIRKEHTQKSEKIGKVLSLEKEVINGYSTINSICIDIKESKISLIGCHPYSNKDGNYVKEKDLKDWNIDLLDDEFNLKSIMKETLKNTSNKFKSQNAKLNVVHVLDREFDDYTIFQYIDEDLNDLFVIRCKIDRNSNTISKETGKFLKLCNKELSNNFNVYVSKVELKGKLYKDVKVVYGYEEVMIEGCKYWFVKIEVLDKNSKPIFKDPMLLITNIPVKKDEVAEIVYHYYLKRSKIEGVFKFLKNSLGWEEFRVKDFESIKNIIALCFFIGQYFYEIESDLIKDSIFQEICLLGNGKGKVTRHYFLEGLSRLANYYITKSYIEEHHISEEQLGRMKAFVFPV